MFYLAPFTAETAARREEAKAKSLEVLQEAREIVALNGNDPERVNKFLKSRHFKELLISLGRKGDMVEADGPRKGRLLLLAFSAPGFGQIPAHAHIGQQHEILD